MVCITYDQNRLRRKLVNGFRYERSNEGLAGTYYKSDMSASASQGACSGH